MGIMSREAKITVTSEKLKVVLISIIVMCIRFGLDLNLYLFGLDFYAKLIK